MTQKNEQSLRDAPSAQSTRFADRAEAIIEEIEIAHQIGTEEPTSIIARALQRMADEAVGDSEMRRLVTLMRNNLRCAGVVAMKDSDDPMEGWLAMADTSLAKAGGTP